MQTIATSFRIVAASRGIVKKTISSSTRRYLASIPLDDYDDINSKPTLHKLFNPTEDHVALREMVRSFTEREVEPQALEHNRSETFNIDLFRKFGSNSGGMGILGLTVPSSVGGLDLDATAVSIVHEELSYSGKLRKTLFVHIICTFHISYAYLMIHTSFQTTDPALCLSYLAHSILLANNLAVNGSDAQLAHFMPRYVHHEVFLFCI